MPSDVIFISSVRHPLRRLVSALHYFAMAKCVFMPVNAMDPYAVVDEFLNNMDVYDTTYNSGMLFS